MTRTVHRFQGELFVIGLEVEHMLVIMSIMAGHLPEVHVEDVRSDNLGATDSNSKTGHQHREAYLRVPTLPVLLTDELHKPVVDSRAVRKEEARPGRELAEKEEALFTADLAMIAIRGQFLQLIPFLELFGALKRDPIHSL